VIYLAGEYLKFWKKWIQADNLERIEIVKDLPITKTYAKLYYPKIDTEGALDIVATMLNSYFEDLLETIQGDPACLQVN
jgi:hypothetical protein